MDQERSRKEKGWEVEEKKNMVTTCQDRVYVTLQAFHHNKPRPRSSCYTRPSPLCDPLFHLSTTAEVLPDKKSPLCRFHVSPSPDARTVKRIVLVQPDGPATSFEIVIRVRARFIEAKSDSAGTSTGVSIT